LDVLTHVLPPVFINSLWRGLLAEKLIFLDDSHRPQRYVETIIRCWRVVQAIGHESARRALIQLFGDASP